jgi:hypothetical protein
MLACTLENLAKLHAKIVCLVNMQKLRVFQSAQIALLASIQGEMRQ